MDSAYITSFDRLTNDPMRMVIPETIKSVRRSLKIKKDLRAWERLGQPVPPPHRVKEQTVFEYAQRFGIKVFFETGTYHGEMVEAVRRWFDQIYSVEVGSELFEMVRLKFASYNHIKLLHGDSAGVILEVLSILKSPALFWLDAHYSGDDTSRANFDTPIVQELKPILSHAVSNHVVLIDDARMFNGLGDYPSLRELKELVARLRSDASFGVRNDIIRIHQQTEMKR
jgi:hypothetical protein